MARSGWRTMPRLLLCPPSFTTRWSNEAGLWLCGVRGEVHRPEACSDRYAPHLIGSNYCT